MKHYDETDVALGLIDGAEELFDARIAMRKKIEMLQDVYDDATALGPDLYADPLVKKTRDMLEELDHDIGIAARQMEHLARQIKKRK
jgi:hypothetical protein